MVPSELMNSVVKNLPVKLGVLDLKLSRVRGTSWIGNVSQTEGFQLLTYKYRTRLIVHIVFVT